MELASRAGRSIRGFHPVTQHILHVVREEVKSQFYQELTPRGTAGVLGSYYSECHDDTITGGRGPNKYCNLLQMPENCVEKLNRD